MVADAITLMGAVADPSASVADSATITARLYELIDDGRAGRPSNPFAPTPGLDDEPMPNDAEGSGDVPEAGQGGATDEYSSLDLPPFMTPVLEELVNLKR